MTRASPVSGGRFAPQTKRRASGPAAEQQDALQDRQPDEIVLTIPGIVVKARDTGTTSGQVSGYATPSVSKG